MTPSECRLTRRFRLIGSKRNWDRGGALTSRLQSFEDGDAGERGELAGADGCETASWWRKPRRKTTPSASCSTWIRPKALSTASKRAAPTTAISSRSATTRCCCSTSMGIAWRRSCVQATCTALRTGRSLLLPEIKRQQAAGKQVTFRGDAAFAKPEIYEFFGGTRSAVRHFAFRPTRAWNWRSKTSCFRPPGRPGRKPLVRYKSFRYQAESWSKPRRIVAKVEHHLGELFPRVGFIVDQHELAKPVGGALLQQARHGRAMD